MASSAGTGSSAPRRASGTPTSSTTTTSVDQPKSPEEGYHLSVDLTDKAIEFIMDAKAVAPEKPFFLYYALGRLPRAPSRAEGVDRPVQGAASTWATRRCASRRSRGRRSSASSPRTPSSPPINPIGTPRREPARTASRSRRWTSRVRWDSLSDDEKQLFCRMAEVYAGFLAHADDQIGRLLDFLEEFGWRENTIVILVSDNGASGEGGPNGSVNEMKFANGIPDDVEANLPLIDELGSPKTYNHYPNGWAMAFNTPFKMWKRYEFNGGTSDPCIISWPAGIKAKGEIRDQYHHAIDLVPDPPRRARCRGARGDQGPRTELVRRREHALELRRRRRAVDANDAVLFDARLAGDLARRLEGRHQPPHDRRLEPLQRRRMGAVPHRGRPLRAAQPRDEQPDKVRELVNLWYARRGPTGVPARRPLARSRSCSPRGRCSPHPATATSTSRTPPRCPSPRRSTSATARSRSARSSTSPRPGAEGVLFAHGSLFGGHALYVKDDRLHYVYNFVGMTERRSWRARNCRLARG